MATISLGTISGNIPLPDASVARSYQVTLSGNLVLGTPGGYVDGDQFQVVLFQNGVGGWVVTLPAAKYQGSVAPVLPVAAGSGMMVAYIMLGGQLWELARTIL